MCILPCNSDFAITFLFFVLACVLITIGFGVFRSSNIVTYSSNEFSIMGKIDLAMQSKVMPDYILCRIRIMAEILSSLTIIMLLFCLIALFW